VRGVSLEKQIYITSLLKRGQMIAKLVEALYYKPGACRFDVDFLNHLISPTMTSSMSYRSSDLIWINRMRNKSNQIKSWPITDISTRNIPGLGGRGLLMHGRIRIITLSLSFMSDNAIGFHGL
jgi:hypothetical protein